MRRTLNTGPRVPTFGMPRDPFAPALIVNADVGLCMILSRGTGGVDQDYHSTWRR